LQKVKSQNLEMQNYLLMKKIRTRKKQSRWNMEIKQDIKCVKEVSVMLVIVYI